MWETDGVLYAFSKAAPADIRENLDLIRPWLDHEDWYLRESAFYAMLGLRETIKRAWQFRTSKIGRGTVKIELSDNMERTLRDLGYTE